MIGKGDVTVIPGCKVLEIANSWGVRHVLKTVCKSGYEIVETKTQTTRKILIVGGRARRRVVELVLGTAQRQRPDDGLRVQGPRSRQVALG